jgi:hypothetical protein
MIPETQGPILTSEMAIKNLTMIPSRKSDTFFMNGSA